MIGLFRSRSEILPLQAEELGLAGAAISDRASLFDARPAPPSGSRRRGRICLPVDAAHAEVFDLEEFLDAVFRALAANAAFLHAAKRHDLGRDDALVDAHDAV